MRPSTSLVLKPSGYGTRRSTILPSTTASSDSAPWDEANEIAGLVQAPEADPHRLAPYRIVHRARHDAVETGRQPGVAFVTSAVAVGVDDDRRPALRFRRVAGLKEHLGVHPADHAGLRAALAHPQRPVCIVAEV